MKENNDLFKSHSCSIGKEHFNHSSSSRVVSLQNVRHQGTKKELWLKTQMALLLEMLEGTIQNPRYVAPPPHFLRSDHDVQTT